MGLSISKTVESIGISKNRTFTWEKFHCPDLRFQKLFALSTFMRKMVKVRLRKSIDLKADGGWFDCKAEKTRKEIERRNGKEKVRNKRKAVWVALSKAKQSWLSHLISSGNKLSI